MNDKTKYYCSELIGDALAHVDIIRPFRRLISPGILEEVIYQVKANQERNTAK